MVAVCAGLRRPVKATVGSRRVDQNKPVLVALRRMIGIALAGNCDIDGGVLGGATVGENVAELAGVVSTEKNVVVRKAGVLTFDT